MGEIIKYFIIFLKKSLFLPSKKSKNRKIEIFNLRPIRGFHPECTAVMSGPHLHTPQVTQPGHRWGWRCQAEPFLGSPEVRQSRLLVRLWSYKYDHAGRNTSLSVDRS